VKRLAQIAYSDSPEVHRELCTYDAFVQSLNDLGLHHQLQAREVTTIEDALREGEAYLLAKQLHRAHVSSQQITVEPGPDTPTQVAATTTLSPLEAEVDRMAAMLEKLVAVLASFSPTEPTQGPLRPEMKDFRSGNRRSSVRTPRYTRHEWQAPRRTSRPVRRPDTFALPLANRFDWLPKVEPAGEVHSDIGGKQTTPPRRTPRHRRPRKLWARRAQPYPVETEHAGGVRVQPHEDSYFLSGKVAGKPITFLLDSGCTMNLLSRRVFDALPRKERREIESYTGEHGTLADESCIPFYGIIELTGRVHDQVIQETFVISQLEEDAILAMPFLKRHGCRINFSKSAILIASKDLTCVNKSGHPLVGGVQVVRSCTVPGHSRATIHYRVNNSQIFGLRVVEGTHGRIQLASSFDRLTEREEILVQCVNPFTESVQLPPGSRLGRFHSVQEEDVGPSLEDATKGSPTAPVQRPGDRPATRPGIVRDSL